MRGRRPQSITPAAVSAVPSPPSWLDRDGKAEWKRVAPTLAVEHRTLSLADLATLANYCAAVGQVAAAAWIIAKEGLSSAGEKGR